MIDKELNKEIYSIGKTWNDYLNGKWVKLNSKQLNFMKQNPNSSLEEIFNMSVKIIDEKEIIEKIREKKTNELITYYMSPAVKSFKINDLTLWFNDELRTKLYDRFRNQIAMGDTEGVIWYEDLKFTLPLNDGISLLDLITRYSFKCLDVFKTHKLALDSFVTKEEIEAYDVTKGYPEKLIF